jgi:hydroxymethylbilane synthase
LGIETRDDDELARTAAARLNHPASELAVSVERSFLAALAAGCSAPLGAWCHAEPDGEWRLQVVVLNPAATQRLAHSFGATFDEAASLAEQAARWALAQGAGDWT